MSTALVQANLNAILFIAGFIAFASGLAALSRPAAAIMCGVLLMALASFPYVVAAYQRDRGRL